MNVSKSNAWRKLKKTLFNLKISRFLKFSTLLFWKIDFFPSKNDVTFLAIERYDIELISTIELINTKISDKHIVLLLEGDHLYHYFEILLILVQNAGSAKYFQVPSFIYDKKHYSLTR